MKKEILLAITSFALLSCGGESKTATTAPKSDADSAKTVSTANSADVDADAPENQSEDHYGIWRMDSTNEVNYKTSHLIAMELCGHVRHVETSDKCSFDFDKDGKMTKYSDSQGELQIMGEPNEESLSLYVPGGSCSYGIDLKNKRLKSFSGGEYSYHWENIYVYDANGKLNYIEEHVTEREDESDNEKSTVTKTKVQVLAVDQHGNWTKVKIGDRLLSRTIYYYDNPLEESSLGECKDQLAVTAQLHGTIGGDNNCSFNLLNGKGSYKNAYGTRIIRVASCSGGKLKVDAFDAKTNRQFGYFEGDFTQNGSQTTYKGVFTNVLSGGKVDFNLK